MRRAGFLIVLALLVGACASSAGSSESQARDTITREHLEAILALDAYGAIQRLRPHWLRGQPDVHENGVRVNLGATFLRTLRIEYVVEMRYVEHDVARTIYGYNIRGGVIEVDTVSR